MASSAKKTDAREAFRRLSLGNKANRYVDPSDSRAATAIDNPRARTWTDDNVSPRQKDNRSRHSRGSKPSARLGSEKAYVAQYSERTYVEEGCHLVTTKEGQELLIHTGGPERICGSANGAPLGNYSTHSSVTAEELIRRLASEMGIDEDKARQYVYAIGRIGQNMILQGELFGIPHVGVIYLKCMPDHSQRLKLRTTAMARSMFDLNGQGIYNYEDAVYDARQRNMSRKYGGKVKPYIPKTKRFTDKKYVIEHVPTEHGIKRRVRFVAEPKARPPRGGS